MARGDSVGSREPGRLREIQTILAQLNDWEQNYGTTYGDAKGLGSTGEANARIADLKDKLCGLGAVFRWNGERYVLVATAAPGQGRQLADLG